MCGIYLWALLVGITCKHGANAAGVMSLPQLSGIRGYTVV
jgi:hypothetical protein